MKAKEPLLLMGYLKANGEFRTVEFRTGVPGKMGGEIRYDADSKGGIILYDMACARSKKTRTCHRTFILNRIAWLLVDGVIYDFRTDRKSIPTDVKDISNKRKVMTVDTGEDEFEEGVLLDNPKVASFTYEKFKISSMRISSRDAKNIRISSRD